MIICDLNSVFFLVFRNGILLSGELVSCVGLLIGKLYIDFLNGMLCLSRMNFILL